MISAEQIPDEVVEAAARSMGWTSAIVLQQDRLRFKGHIAAALSAWPGATTTTWFQDTCFVAVINLPTPHSETKP